MLNIRVYSTRSPRAIDYERDAWAQNARVSGGLSGTDRERIRETINQNIVHSACIFSRIQPISWLADANRPRSRQREVGHKYSRSTSPRYTCAGARLEQPVESAAGGGSYLLAASASLYARFARVDIHFKLSPGRYTLLSRLTLPLYPFSVV